MTGGCGASVAVSEDLNYPHLGTGMSPSKSTVELTDVVTVCPEGRLTLVM